MIQLVDDIFAYSTPIKMNLLPKSHDRVQLKPTAFALLNSYGLVSIGRRDRFRKLTTEDLSNPGLLRTVGRYTAFTIAKDTIRPVGGFKIKIGRALV